MPGVQLKLRQRCCPNDEMAGDAMLAEVVKALIVANAFLEAD